MTCTECGEEILDSEDQIVGELGSRHSWHDRPPRIVAALIDQTGGAHTEAAAEARVAEPPRIDYPRGYPMSVPDVERLNALVKRVQERAHFWHYGGLVEQIEYIISHYEEMAVKTIEAAKLKRDDLIVYLRALSMVVEMAGNASTHKEKAARLRGLSELIESGIDKLRRETFDVASVYHGMPDLFRSDFPVREYMDRIRDLEAQLKEVQEASKTKAKDEDPLNPFKTDDVPF